MIKGFKLPKVTFKTRVRDESSGDDNPYYWQDTTTDDYFKGKRVVLFSLPGAFTPTCSEYQLPGFEESYDNIRNQDIDEIYCMSVNDAFVMNAWGEERNVGEDVLMLSDGNGDFTAAIGLEMDGSGFGLGTRSQRYAMIIDDGVVSALNVESGPGLDVSSAETILGQL